MLCAIGSVCFPVCSLHIVRLLPRYDRDPALNALGFGLTYHHHMARLSCVIIIIIIIITCLYWGVHCSLSAVTHAPFHASMLRPPSQAGPMHEAAGVGKLVNAALLSLINEACVNVCCATLPSRVNSSAPLVCRHDRVTREAGRVGLVGRDRGRRGY